MTATVRLCALDDLVDGEAARFDLGSVGVAVVRLGDDVYVIGAQCSHQDVDLSDGEVVADDLTLECPKHGSAFDLATGEALSLPATRGVPVFEAHVVDGEVLVSSS